MGPPHVMSQAGGEIGVKSLPSSSGSVILGSDPIQLKEEGDHNWFKAKIRPNALN